MAKETANPFETPAAGTISREGVASRFRVVKILAVAFLGIVFGSWVSAELLYVHHPTEVRTQSEVIGNTIAGTLTSPIGMSFGLLATFRFFAGHGWLVLPGILLVVIGVVQFWRHGSSKYLLVTFIGFVLWAHNNYLSFNALMSV